MIRRYTSVSLPELARADLVPGDPRYAAIEKKLDAAPAIAVPTITVDGKYDPFTPPGDGAAYRAHFTGKYAHRTLPVGHNVPARGTPGLRPGRSRCGSFLTSHRFPALAAPPTPPSSALDACHRRSRCR